MHFFFVVNSRKKLKPGSLPTLNMPVKSHASATPVKRRLLERKPAEDHPISKTAYLYSNFEDVTSKIKSLQLSKLKHWLVTLKDDRVILKKYQEHYLLPHEICIDDSLGFNIAVFNWQLPSDHPLYTRHRRSIRHISVSSLIEELECLSLCNGLPSHINTKDTLNHVIPKLFDHLTDDTSLPYNSTEYVRSVKCEVLPQSPTCNTCNCAEWYAMKVSNNNSRKMNTPAKPNAPVSKTSSARLKLTLQGQRMKCQQLEDELRKMRNDLAANSVLIDKEISDDFVSVLDQNNVKMTPFMKLFWEEQLKMYKTSQKGVRYHPMIIRFCLSLHSKSASAYEELRDALGRKQGGLLTLPCKRTLRDYKNWITPKMWI